MATIEIFHDVESGVGSTEQVMAGIDILNAVIGGLHVIRSNRQIKLTKPGEQFVRPEKIRFPNFEANISLIQTDRPIYIEESSKNQFSHGIAIGGRDVAIVSSFAAQEAEFTTAHELAHLYELKGPGPKHDDLDPSHCIDDNCIMYRIPKFELTEIEPKNISERIKRKLGFSAVKFSERMVTTSFCDDCSEELHRNAKKLSIGHAVHLMKNVGK